MNPVRALCTVAALGLVVGAQSVIDVPVATATTSAVSLVSATSEGLAGDGFSAPTMITPNGRYALFSSTVADLVDGEANPAGILQVYLRDLQSGTTELISRNAQETPGDDDSYGGFVSANGRYVAFTSAASNLVSGDTNGFADAFLRDRVTGTVERISVRPDGSQIPVGGWAGPVSVNGHVALFGSFGAVTPQTQYYNDGCTFVRNRSTGTTTDLLGATTKLGHPYPYPSSGASLNGSGGLAVVAAANLLPDDNDQQQGYLVDLSSGAVQRLTDAVGGGPSDGAFDGGTLSFDGRFVAYTSEATDLDAVHPAATTSAYLYDRQTGVTENVGRGANGPLDDLAMTPSVSEDGRYVAFASSASNVVAPATPAGRTLAYVLDRGTDTTELASVSGSGARPDDNVSLSQFALTDDASGLLAGADAGNLLPAPGASAAQVLLFSRATAHPAVSVGGITDGANYEFGAVPVATCQVSDPLDGTVSFAATLTGPTGARSADGLGAVTVTCSYTDGARATGTAQAAYAVVDTTGPVISTPTALTVAATGPHTPVTFTVSAADLVSGVRPVGCQPASGNGFAVGLTTVTCTAGDRDGNTTSVAFPVTVTDVAAPVVTAPAAQVAEATGSDGAVVDYPAVSAQDDVDGSLSPDCDHASGARFPLGVTTVTCTATDAHGNTGTAAFAVTVQDASAPVVTAPAAQVAEATGSDGAVVDYPAVSAQDDVDGSLSPDCDHASGARFPLGVTTVTCTATDAHGNTGTAAFAVTVQDTTAPEVEVPATVVVEASGPLGTAVDLPAVTVHDAVDGSLDPHCTAISGQDFGLGDTQVTCTATDARGNIGTGTFTVRVRDTTAPVLTVPADLTLEATGPDGAVVNYPAVTAQDTVDGPLPVTCLPVSGETFGLGVTTVTCTAADAHGNTGTATFTVTVTDSTAPTLAVPANLTVEATGEDGAQVDVPDAQALDLVDLVVGVECDHGGRQRFGHGVTTVACTATDAHGNRTSGSFTVTVTQDVPVVQVPAKITVEATGPDGASVQYPDATATDPFGLALQPSCTPAAGSTFALGETTVTCLAADAAGGVGRNHFVVDVVDTTPPVLGAVAARSTVADSRSGRTVSFPLPTAADTVSGAVTASCDPASGSLFGLGTTTVTCTATDEAGNAAHESFPVTVAYAWHLRNGELVDHGRYRYGQHVQVRVHLDGASRPVHAARLLLWASRISEETGAGDVRATQELTPTRGNAFSYDPATGDYLLELDTRLLAPGTWQFRLDLGQGVPTIATVTLAP